jgi:erythritol kinase (D-erythritol 1-phosphate-forming)
MVGSSKRTHARWAAVAQPSDVLIGLDVGATRVDAAAFASDGHQLARVAAPGGSQGAIAGVGIEPEVGETWRAATAALRQLGQAVPQLAARTAALAITGGAGGTCLIDDDGDAVAPAWLPHDPRAEQVVRRWRRDGSARRIREVTGSPVDASLQSAGLVWLAEHRSEALDRAASAFTAKDCVYFLCTGERATDAAAAAAAFGDWRTGGYEARVIELLGLRRAAHLLPEIIDGTGRHSELTTAAAAATGLIAGTPVVLAPVGTIAIALALGLGGRDADIGGTVLGTTYAHMRVCGDQATAASLTGEAAILPLPLPGRWLGLARQSGTANVDWLIGMAEQLLVDAGLIGLARGELRAMLERRAAEAAPASPRYRPFAGTASAHAALEGLSSDTTFHDLLRAIYQGLGLAARDCYAALGLQPTEVRAVDAGGAGPLAHEALAACLGAPLRTRACEAPAAAGAALVAAVSLGHYRDVVDGFAEWVEPRLLEAQTAARKLDAGLPLSSTAPAPA